MAFRPARILSGAALLALLFFNSPSLVAAEPATAVDGATRAAARDLGSEGVSLYGKGDFEGALVKLEKAYAVLKVPSLALWSARALAKTGRLVEAAERYLEGSRLAVDGGQRDVQEAAKSDALKEREELLPKIPKLRLVLAGAAASEVEVRIGDAVVPVALLGEFRPTNPGSFEIVVRVGEAFSRENIVLVEGETRTVTMNYPESRPRAEVATATPGAKAVEPVAPAETSAPSYLKPLGWTLVGVGAASLATGGVFGFLAMDKQSQLPCPNNACAPELAGEVSSYNTMRLTSGITLIAGGVLAAAGVTCLWLVPDDEGKSVASVRPWAGLGMAGVKGGF